MKTHKMLITVPGILEMFNKYLLLVVVIAAAEVTVVIVNSNSILGIGK